MTIANKMTTLRSSQGSTDVEIQAHLDAMNADGWHLITLDNLVGWYRFFWAKEVVEGE